MIKYEDDSGIKDYLTVVRNMLVNTNDKSQREWPGLLPMLRNLASINIYELLLDLDWHIEVIYSEQQKEERLKARQISKKPQFKPLLQMMENYVRFQGNISSLLGGACVDGEVDYNTLGKLYEAYKLIAEYDFYEVWGDLLATDVYEQTRWRVSYNAYRKHPSIIQLAKDVMDNDDDVEGVLLRRECDFIISIQEKYNGELSAVNQPKEQLYLLYILSRRILGYGIEMFFANGYRLGWFKKNVSGVSPLFDNLYEDSGMIYQCYSSSFQYIEEFWNIEP